MDTLQLVLGVVNIINRTHPEYNDRVEFRLSYSNLLNNEWGGRFIYLDGGLEVVIDSFQNLDGLFRIIKKYIKIGK